VDITTKRNDFWSARECLFTSLSRLYYMSGRNLFLHGRNVEVIALQPIALLQNPPQAIQKITSNDAFQ